MASELNQSSIMMKKRKRKRKRKRDDLVVGTYYYNNCLPMELIQEILSWVPGKDVLRFKCVSRSWYELVKDPKFIQLHRARSHDSFLLSSARVIYSFDHHHHHQGVSSLYSPPSDFRIFRGRGEAILRVEGTCDGLICLRSISDNGRKHYLIYNPTTRLSKTILANVQFHHPTFVLGFGYDCVSHDYKVLLLRTSLELQLHLQWPSKFPSLEDDDDGGGQRSTMMYSLKTDAWEPVENPPWNFWSIRHSSGPCVNNSFHWLLPKPETGGKEIKFFHLHTRRYSEMPLPETICNIPSSVLTVFNGKLCVVTDSFDIWVLNEYGNHKSWTRLFHNQSAALTLITTVSPDDVWCLDLRIACFTDQRNNFILLVTPDSIGAQPASWFYCDVESQKTTKIEMPDFPKYLGLAASQPWVESLVPLH